MNKILKDDWNKFWDVWDYDFISKTEFNYSSHQGKITADILKRRNPQEKILEAGCGLGNWFFLFEKMGFKSYGIDISFNSLVKAVEYNQNFGLEGRVLQGDLRTLPFKDNSFDIIFSYGAIEHFPDSPVALKDFFRILNRGGLCLITTPNPYSFHRLFGRHLLKLTKSRKLGFVGYEDAYTPKQLADMLRVAGFQKVDYGVLNSGMGYLFGDFWPAIPVVGKFIFKALLKLTNFIEAKQNLIGGGSFAVGVKVKSKVDGFT